MAVYQRGRRWYVDIYLNDGRRIRRVAGRTKREALLKLGEIERRIEEEEKYGTPVEAPRTFTEYAQEYLKYSKAHKKHSTYTRDALTIKRLLPHLGNKKLTAITTKDAERFQTLRANKIKKISVNREMETLKHMLNRAVDLGYIKDNPARRVKNFKKEPSWERKRFLTFEERERLLEECRQSENPMLYPLILTALETGMRRGELFGLTWSDVNLERREIFLKNTKNREPRIVPISERLFPVLERLYVERRGTAVFAKDDGSPLKECKRSFGTACRRAGIEDFRFHDLRHTFASYLAMSGVDLRTLQELLGHKDIKMTMRYSHLSKRYLRTAVNQMVTNWSQVEKTSVEQSPK